MGWGCLDVGIDMALVRLVSSSSALDCSGVKIGGPESVSLGSVHNRYMVMSWVFALLSMFSFGVGVWRMANAWKFECRRVSVG